MFDLTAFAEIDRGHLALGLAVVAPFLGSFAACVADRLAKEQPVIAARSRCCHCNHTLGARDLVPLVSFIWLRGRCRYCTAPIPFYLPASELAALAITSTAICFVPTIWLLPSCLLGWTLLALAIMDVRYYVLADAMTFGLAGLGLVLTWALNGDEFWTHVSGMLIGGGGLIVVNLLYRRLRHIDGLGMGDVKLMGAAGAWLGIAPLLSVISIAAIGALAVVGSQALAGRVVTSTFRVPLGFYIACSIWIVWIIGPLELGGVWWM